MSTEAIAIVVLAVLGSATALGVVVLAVEMGRVLIRLDPSRSDLALVPGEGLRIGDHVPGLTLRSFPDGRVLDLTDSSTLLVFVSASCEPCRQLWPGVIRLANRRRDLNVVAVVADDPVALAQSDQAGKAISYVFDNTGEVADQFQVRRTPFVYVVWAGLVRSKGVANRYEQLLTLLEGHGVSSTAPWRLVDELPNDSLAR